VPLVNKSYYVVTWLKIPSGDELLPVLHVIDSNEQQISSSQLVVRFKHFISIVRTIFYVLETAEPKSNLKVINMAANIPGFNTEVQPVFGGQRYCCCLFIDIVLVAYAEAATQSSVKERLYTAAVELLLFKPHVYLVSAQYGTPVRLVAYDKPVDNGEEVSPRESHFTADEKSRSCAGHNTEDCDAASDTCSAGVAQSTDDLLAAMACFHHLSNKVKAVSVRSLTAMVLVLLKELKETKLPSHTCVTDLNSGQGYRCDLYVASVFVARGEAVQKTIAGRKAYMNAAELLKKPYLRLANDNDSLIILVGSDKPFEELPAAQRRPEFDLSLSNVIDPAVGQTSENADSVNRALASRTLNSMKYSAGNNAVVAVSASADDVPVQQENKQDEDNYETCGTGSELLNTLQGETHGDITSSMTDVQTQSVNDISVDELHLVEYSRTTVTARSHRDLSHLINQFHFLAYTAKNIYAMFKGIKIVKEMLEMAVHMSNMHLEVEVVELAGGRVQCQLLLSNVLAAVAKHCDKTSATVVVYSVAFEALCMPCLCLEEKHDAVRLLGSNKPFLDSLPSRHDFSMDPCASVDHGSSSANVMNESLTVLPCSAELSELVSCFHSFVCRVKAISESAAKHSNDIGLIHSALGSKMHAKSVFTEVTSVVCELSINNVEVACGKAADRKRAKHVTYSMAVELLKKPYLRIRESPEHSHSYKLIGSDKPFVGMTAGVLPCEQNCVVVSEKGKFVLVEKSTEPQDNIDHSSATARDGGKLGSEACFKESVNANTEPGDLGNTQISTSTYSMDIAELVSQFRKLADRVKSMLVDVHSSADVIQKCLVETELYKKQVTSWQSDGTSVHSELSIDGVLLSSAEADTTDHATHAAYSAALDLLSKRYLQLEENTELKRSYRLVGSDEAFVAASAELVQTSAAGDNSLCCKVMSSRSSSPASGNEQHIETVAARSLSEFVILQTEGEASIHTLHNSIAFNNKPLSYKFSQAKEGLCCLAILGAGQTLASVVGKGKKDTKKAAADEALKMLRSTCYTLRVKKRDVLANALTRNKVWIYYI